MTLKYATLGKFTKAAGKVRIHMYGSYSFSVSFYGFLNYFFACGSLGFIS